MKRTHNWLLMTATLTILFTACKKDDPQPSVKLDGTRWTDTTWLSFPTSYNFRNTYFEGDGMRTFDQEETWRVYSYRLYDDNLIDITQRYYVSNGDTVQYPPDKFTYKAVIRGDKLYLVSAPYDENINNQLDKFHWGDRF